MRPGMNRGNFQKKNVKASNIKGTLVRLGQYMQANKWLLAMVSLIVVVSSVLSVLGPYIMGRTIDLHLEAKNLDGFLRPIGLLALVYIANAFFTWLSSYLVIGISQQTVKDVRKDLFEHLQVLPVEFFDKQKDGDLVSRLTNDVDNISNTLNQSLVQLISSLVTLVAVFFMMVILDIRLTLVSIFTIPMVILITKTIAKYTRRYYKDKSRDLGSLNAFSEESISGQKITLAYGQEETMVQAFHEKNEAYKQSAIKAETLSSIMGPIMNFMNNLVYAVMAFVGGYMVIKDMTSVGVVVIFISYSRQFARPINQIASLYNTIQGAIAGAERVFEVIDQEGEPEAGDQMDIKGQVKIKALDFAYDKDMILRDISMEAKQGDMVAIVGPTGAGKTTLINLLTRFYDVKEGAILVDDRSIHELDLNHFRSQLGIVLQDTYLFEGSVMDNIRYGRPGASLDQVIQAAKLSNAHKFIHRLPEGYHTLIEGEGLGISQGQRQLIAIARAILADPKILILDEATSSIDTRTEKEIQKGLQNLMKGRTSFVIAHRLSTIQAADTIYVIDKGTIVEAGNHQDLLDQTGVYHDMYTTQFKVS